MLIPAKIAAYTYHLNNTSTITDAPTIRSLRFILQDEFDDWRDGEMMLQSLIETEDELQRAADHQAKLQTLLLAAGGIAGPGSIGESYVTERGDPRMRKSFPVEDLARDARFVRVPIMERINDPRTARREQAPGKAKRGPGRLTPDRPDAPDAARALMHGIFVGEIQALEGAGRTCWDFEVGTATARIPRCPSS